MWALWLPLAAAQEGAAGPSPATVVYYNARMALDEGEPLEAAKLWLLRNALASRTGEVSVHDPDFGSAAWVALGELGICADGLAPDTDGAGLWPLATHNWVVRNLGHRAKGRRPRPFDAFDVGRQQRFVSIEDVLSAGELREVSLFRGACLRPRLLLTLAGESVNARLSDRQVAARFLLFLLDRADDTVVRDRVRGTAVLDARRFDLYLQLTALSAREAREQARYRARIGRSGGLSKESAKALLDEAPDYAFGPDSEAARVLRECPSWPVSEWMALSAERRRFLFLHARAYGADPAVMDALALGILDALVARGDGPEVTEWIGLRTADPATTPEPVWAGERGARLLSLGEEAAFRERSVVALHRGVRALEAGDLPEALRSMAYALSHAGESTASDTVARLSRRWLSYVAGQYEVTDALLVTLHELVPVRDFQVVLEDLLWRAAFHADAASFERARRHQAGSGALARRAELLTPLATGDGRAFAAAVGEGLKTSPSETLRFLELLLQRLELEDGDVRDDHVGTLRDLETLLGRFAAASEGRQIRTATALQDRCRAIREGVGGAANPWDRLLDDATGLAPDHEVFAGSLRLAPGDPLPWPFQASDVPAPSVFDPLRLVPVVWTDGAGERVFGWSLEG